VNGKGDEGQRRGMGGMGGMGGRGEREGRKGKGENHTRVVSSQQEFRDGLAECREHPFYFRIRRHFI
jgi:hypothetical protein